MRKLLGLILITSLLFCKNEMGNKDNSESILLNLGLFQGRNNRLTVSGTAVKGLVKNGTVNVSPLGADGTCNSSVILATTSTDSSGNYSLTYPKTGGVICLTVSSSPEGKTTMFDEKTNADVSIPSGSNFKLVTVIPESRILSDSRRNTMVSPFSKLLARRLETLIKQGGSGADPNALYKKASKEIVIRFGLQNGLSLASSRSILPSISAVNLNLSDADYPELEDIVLDLQNPSSPITAKFISILVGFSQLANKHKRGSSISIDDIDSMVEAFASDFEDGVFDGRSANGASITVGSGSSQITFSGSPLTTVLLPAVVSYFREGGRLSVGGSATTASVNVSQITDQVQFVDTASIIATNTTNLVYTGSPFSFTQNTAITPIIPTIVGTISNCASSPTLPVGLTLSSTCTISGTPTVTQANTSYTITATSASGNATAIISIGITSPIVPLTLAYAGSPFTFTQNVAITSINPTSNGTISSCTSSPTLPTGLTLSATCIISGTPTIALANTNYTITATSASRTATAVISIGINSPTVPLTLSYTGSPFSFTQNAAITSISPTSNGTISSCSSSPTLPTGLTLSATCVISGTPTTAQANTNYTITATSASRTATAVIVIGINSPSVPLTLSYTGSPFSFTQNTTITSISPTSNGTISSCSSSPTLPTGLTLSATCVISGTPTISQANTNYTISANSATGTTSATVSIAVNVMANISYPSSSYTFVNGQAINIPATVQGGTITSCTVNIALPSGLSLNSSTCALTGTPTTNQSVTSYTISVTNPGGTASVSLNISVVAATSLSYAGSPFSLSHNAAMGVLTPTTTGSISSCTSAPALPAGLSISATTCAISGTPTATQGNTNYTITASGTTGTATANITIAVVTDSIAGSLTSSLTAYNAAAINDLVKVTQTEYNAVETSLSAVKGGYTGTLDSNWATAVATNQTYAFQASFSHANTIHTLPASSYVVAMSFTPSLNPQNSFSCQLKYSTGSSLTNLSNLYSGNTIATTDRQFFVIKRPNLQVPASPASYLSIFTSSGIGTISLVAHNYDYVAGNQVGAQTFTSGSAASTQYPTMQVLTTTTKSW